MSTAQTDQEKSIFRNGVVAAQPLPGWKPPKQTDPTHRQESASRVDFLRQLHQEGIDPKVGPGLPPRHR